MAKWQSKAQLQEQEYRNFFRQVYPELEKKMQAFVDTYDESAPVEAGMENLSSIALLRRRMAKYCVWPAMRAIETTATFRGNAVTEAIEKFCKPMQEESDRKRRQQEKERREAFKIAVQSRQIVHEGNFRSAIDLGEIAIVKIGNDERVLICVYSDFVKADRDINQFQDSYFCKFAEPTPEEQATPAYKSAVEKIEIDMRYNETLKQQARANWQDW